MAGLERRHPRRWSYSKRGQQVSLPRSCPFCGSGNTNIVCHSVGCWFFVYCTECGANGPEENTKAKAALAWNRRADDANRDDKDGRGSIRPGV
ncbi:Lar family restriction alleviation protein [Atlantibacter hermannii]|uniref:Lar family restriction alleviation protein n=1 Tax=Atlantibacter hermannii TaxID=565 RepID=UPI003B22141A